MKIKTKLCKLLLFVFIFNSLQMAHSKDNKKILATQLLPDIDFNVSASGITVKCDRLNMPRFVQFDVTGKCKSCRSVDVEIDYVVTAQGITIYSNRLKSSAYVAFDVVYDFPEHCFFRLKSRGKIFNIFHNFSGRGQQEERRSNKRIADQNIIDEFLESAKKPKMDEQKPPPPPTPKLYQEITHVAPTLAAMTAEFYKEHDKKEEI